ncbi:MAG: DMT family transporter [Alicyclobacillus herbarius]|uniref:DMT family transporter n=1 Tax=Alicyclobacillus herbarius TaxID=122960 RepID=UPI002354D3DB|nr:DMT family transporter [Alicyclobacillus herbarius]MCL6632491.1 DMT family transporter [Alicyclobacillus herbarius]
MATSTQQPPVARLPFGPARSGKTKWLFVLLGVGVIAVSFSAIFIKWTPAPASVIGMYRLLFTLPLVLPMVVRRRREIRQVRRQDAMLLALSGVFLGLHFLCWIGSFAYTSVASSMILLSLQPVFVMIGAYFLFGERTRLGGILAMLLALIGSAVIALADAQGPHRALYGDMLSLLGTLAVSGYMLTGQRLRTRMDSGIYSFFVFLGAAALLAVYNLWMGIPLAPYPKQAWWMFVLMAVIPTLFGHSLFNWLLQHIRATHISMAILGEPVGAILLACLLLGAPLRPLQALGGLLTLGGVCLFLKLGTPESENEFQKDAGYDVD